MRGLLQQKQKAGGRHPIEGTGGGEYFAFAAANITFLLVEWYRDKKSNGLRALLVFCRERCIDSSLRVVAVHVVVRDACSEQEQ